MQRKFYFQRALIARNRLKRQAMAKPVLSEQEVNTIKERVTYFGHHFGLDMPQKAREY